MELVGLNLEQLAIMNHQTLDFFELQLGEHDTFWENVSSFLIISTKL